LFFSLSFLSAPPPAPPHPQVDADNDARDDADVDDVYVVIGVVGIRGPLKNDNNKKHSEKNHINISFVFFFSTERSEQLQNKKKSISKKETRRSSVRYSFEEEEQISNRACDLLRLID